MKTSASLVAVLLPLSALAQVALNVDGQADKVYAPGDPKPTFALAAQFDPASVSVAAEVTAFKLPSGRGSGNEPCTVAGPTAGPFKNRAAFTVSVEPNALEAPGEYVCSVRFDAITNDSKSVAASVSKDFRVTRIEPSLTSDSLVERTVPLVRPFPGWSADATLPWRATEGTMLTPVTLTVRPGALFRSGTSRVGLGAVAIDPAEHTLEAGGSKTFKVALRDFGSAGTFETELRFESRAFAAAKTAKLKIEVTDFWLWPLLAILLGVAGGAWANAYVKRSRPALETRIEALTVNERARLLEASIESSEDRVAFEEVEVSLAEVDRKLAVGDVQEADTALTAAIGKLSALETRVFKALAEQQDRLARLRRSLDETRGSALFSQNLPATVSDELRRSDDAVDDAMTCVDEKPMAARRSIDAGVDALTRAYEAMRTDLLAQNANPNAVAQAEIAAFAKALEPKDLNMPDFAAALAALERLDAALQPQLAAKGARAAPPMPRIEIVTPAEGRRAGQPIEFELVDLPSPAAGAPTPRVQWTFANSSEAVGAKVTHVFVRKGTYKVVAAYGGNTESIELRVMPSELVNQQAALIKATRRKDFILTAIAAVLAAFTGLSQLYVGHVFGSLGDYVVALIWGFGIERSAHGFAAIFTAIKA